jgi:hypothetical protein
MKDTHMAFLATTRRAFDDYVALNIDAALWVSATLVGDEEVRRLRSAGKSVTTFAYEVRSEDPELLSEALATILEHHPNQSIWVDAQYPA